MKRIAVFMIIVFLALGSAPGLARSTDESYVIGRITGTHRELPGYFRNSTRLVAQGIDEVEFPGFRLLRVVDDKRFLIRPNHEGYFYQDLPSGEYTLTRKRNDRPGYKEPKTIDILRFEVKPRALVNLGTIHIVLDGEPRESLRSSQYSAKGKYTYRYRYEREPGDSAYEEPLNWFTEKKPRAAGGFRDRVVREDTAVTDEGDGSKVVLEEIVPRSDR